MRITHKGNSYQKIDGYFHDSSHQQTLFLKASLLTIVFAFLHPVKVLASFSARQQSSGRLNLHNIHTGEKINTIYRNQDGQYNAQAIKEINWLLRCHYANQQYPIDNRL
ncbi:MAG: DUF882 domain-containing protein [Smithellaceae bacterium]